MSRPSSSDSVVENYERFERELGRREGEMEERNSASADKTNPRKDTLFAQTRLTPSLSDISLTSVVRTCHTYENNFGMRYKFAKYLKESWRWSSDYQLSVKYFLDNGFVWEISPK